MILRPWRRFRFGYSRSAKESKNSFHSRKRKQYTSSGIARFPWNDSERGAVLRKHLPHITDKKFRFFVRRKVSSARVLRFKHNIAQQFLPTRKKVQINQWNRKRIRHQHSRHDDHFFGEVRHSHWDGGRLRRGRIALVAVVQLVVDPQRRCGSRAREIIARYPGEDYQQSTVNSQQVEKRENSRKKEPSSSSQEYSSVHAIIFS